MRKRLLCVVLTLAMLFSVQSAAAATGNTRSTVITATLTNQTPTIKVTVPSTAEVYLNPLKLPVSINSKSTREQIVSTPCVIANESDVPLQVDVTVTGQINEGSNMSLVTSSTKNSTSTSKRAFIYFEIQPADTDDFSKVVWDAAYSRSKRNHIPVTTMERTKTNTVVLASTTLDGEIAEKGGYAAFRLTGDAVVNPRKAWTEDDGLTVEIAFTFVPLVRS